MPKDLNSEYSLDGNSSGMITWTGPCISCLGIKPGDSLNTVTTIIANKVCELDSPLNVSELTLECALDVFNKQEVGTRTIQKVLQLLLDNDCGLKELIDNIQLQIDGISDVPLVLDLKCLKETDSFGNSLPYNQQSVLQTLINEVCDLDTRLTDLSGKYTTLKNQVDNFVIPSGDEKIVTTTVSGPKVVSLALIDVAKSYTDYRDVLGTVGQIQTAMSRQTSTLNTLMAGVEGWVTTPTTEAQSINNLWLLMTNFASRIASNEQCCATSCEDIKIGFIPSFNENTVILKFTSGAGTVLPTGWIDNGSFINITNKEGVSMRAPIVISLNGESEELDLSSFVKGDILNFNIELKMKNGAEICEKCINKTIEYLDDGCCVLTNTSNDDVTIIYETSTTYTV